MRDRVRVAVFDDHPLLREGIVHSFRKSPEICVVGEGASADEAVCFGLTHKPDLMLLDVSMPGGGILAAQKLKNSCPGIKTVMLTVSEREEDVSAAMDAGVRGYVLKGIGGADLARIVINVAAGQSYVSPTLAARTLMAMQKRWTASQAPKRRDSDLTSREEQILEQVSNGLTNKEIALELQLSEKTIKHYMTSVLHKLNARNRVEAIIEARRRRLGPNH